MRENELYLPMIRGAQIEGFTLFHPQEGGSKAPFDLCGIVQVETGGTEHFQRGDVGLAIAAEVKLVKRQPRDGEGIPWRLFESHQLTWLKAYAGAGGMALCILVDPAHHCVVYVIDMHLNLLACTDLVWTRADENDVFTGWSRLIPLWMVGASIKS